MDKELKVAKEARRSPFKIRTKYKHRIKVKRNNFKSKPKNNKEQKQEMVQTAIPVMPVHKVRKRIWHRLGVR